MNPNNDPSLRFDHASKELEALVRLFGRSDGELSWSAAKGALSLKQGDGGLPERLYPFISIRTHKFTRHEDGFIEDLLAAIIVMNADGGSVLQSHTAPDGQVNDIKPFPYRQAYFHCPHSGTHRVDLDTRDITRASIWSGSHLAPFTLEWSASNGVGWTNYVNPHERMGGIWSDCYRFRFSIETLLNTDVASVPSSYGYLGESPAPPWLGVPGTQAVWQAWGAKYMTPDTIPAEIQVPAASAVPDLINPDLFSSIKQ